MIKYNICRGRTLRIAVGITMLVLVMADGAVAAMPISSCGTISSPGEYILTQNIENFSMGTCIAITSNDVVFDGANYVIDGVTKNYTYGVYVNNQLTTLKNVTVKNLKVTDWYYGIYYQEAQNGNITNSIVSLNGNESLSIVINNTYRFYSRGISLDNSNDISITNNTINLNNQSGIDLYQSSNNNILKNNIESNNFDGVMLVNDSSYNNIENNKVSNHSYEGIAVIGSSNNIIKNNSIENNEAGVVLGIWVINMSSGIEVYSNNNTLTNNTINSNNQSGITLSRSCNNNTLTNNIINSNNQTGIFLTQSSNNNIENNKVSNNQYGIKLSSSSSNNTIYNNYFNNINNYILKKNFDNLWNISRLSGNNIIGGSYLGGNFWAYPNGTGFSQTCPDTDNDGICDSSYVLDINNTDYLPLAQSSGTPVESSTGKGTVFFNTDTGVIENLTAVDVSDIPEAPPGGANLYYGLFRFNITGITSGSSVNLTLTFPSNLPANSTYWKYGANASNTTPHWYIIPSTIKGSKLTLNLTDGGIGDDDLAPNGRIKDDGGPSKFEMPIQVANPSASPAIILNDNSRARPLGTNITRLNITVIGSVASVSIDLSSIGGSTTAYMTKILGTDIYSIRTNATAGINLTNNLVVNATDTSGNFNNSVGIPVTVLLRGDIVRDNKIDLKDLLYMRRYIAGLEPSINTYVADIQPAEGDGKVDLKDLLFLRKYLAGLEPLI